MHEMIGDSMFFGAILSLVGYEVGLFCKKKFKKAIFNPLLISVAFIMIILMIFHVSYKEYDNSAKYLSYLLTPTTVCLAIPLYQQFELLKKNMKAISIGIFSGVLASLGSIFALSLLFGLNHQEYVTLLPKSITAAIGMGVSEELGGMVTISVASIMITGILGNMIAPSICKLFRIHEPIAKGLAIGTAAHAIGTAKAMEMGEIEGAMSSLAIAVAGLITVITASFFATFI